MLNAWMNDLKRNLVELNYALYEININDKNETCWLLIKNILKKLISLQLKMAETM